MVNLSETFANATTDSIVHLTYAAGRSVNAQGKREFNQARDWNKAPREFVGNFVSLKRNKKGEQVLTLFVHNRGEAGAYRTFNEKVGTILSLSVDEFARA